MSKTNEGLLGADYLDIYLGALATYPSQSILVDNEEATEINALIHKVSETKSEAENGYYGYLLGELVTMQFTLTSVLGISADDIKERIKTQKELVKGTSVEDVERMLLMVDILDQFAADEYFLNF